MRVNNGIIKFLIFLCFLTAFPEIHGMKRSVYNITFCAVAFCLGAVSWKLFGGNSELKNTKKILKKTTKGLKEKNEEVNKTNKKLETAETELENEKRESGIKSKILDAQCSILFFEEAFFRLQEIIWFREQHKHNKLKKIKKRLIEKIENHKRLITLGCGSENDKENMLVELEQTNFKELRAKEIVEVMGKHCLWLKDCHGGLVYKCNELRESLGMRSINKAVKLPQITSDVKKDENKEKTSLGNLIKSTFKEPVKKIAPELIEHLW